MPMSGDKRICVLHANIPNVISQVTTVVGGTGANIENMMNKSKGDNAYTVVDVIGDVSDETVEKLSAIEGVYRIRVI